jgi:CRISPR-associated endonuclease/helicase Cas3
VELVGALSCAAPQEGLFHLSTAMCPRHRERTLDQVRSRLTERQRCVLVSTQCVEAGVDVDFPSVLRAFGPLDAIAQAAGRCNRNGRLPRAQSCVRVFLPEDERYPPGGGYGQAAGVTRMLLREKGTDRMDINDPALFEDYYRRLFDLTQPETLNRELLEAIQARDFPAVAKEYRVVDQDSVNVLVAFDLDEFHALEDELQSSGTLTREWMRRARRSAVSLFRSEVEHTPNIRPAPLMKGGFSTDWYISTRPEDYDQILGYKPSAEFFL